MKNFKLAEAYFAEGPYGLKDIVVYGSNVSAHGSFDVRGEVSLYSEAWDSDKNVLKEGYTLVSVLASDDLDGESVTAADAWGPQDFETAKQAVQWLKALVLARVEEGDTT